jgi:uncharacterized Fe-S center protein
MAALVLDGIRAEKPRPAEVAPVDEVVDEPWDEVLPDSWDEPGEDVALDEVVADAEAPTGQEPAPEAEEYPFEPAHAMPVVVETPPFLPAEAPPFITADAPAHTETLFTPPAPESSAPPFLAEPTTPMPVAAAAETPAAAPEPVGPGPNREPATVWFVPMRSEKKESLVKRVGKLLKRAGLEKAIADGDLVAVKLHFGEEGNTGFVHPIFLREVVRRVRKHGGRPFLTDCNTLYRGKRANAVDHVTCAVRNGFGFSTVNAPIIIADGLDGRDGIDVPIGGFKHFDSVRIGSAVVHADAMVVVSHVKGHEATGFGGAMKNVGMGLGTRSAKQRMHSDLKPQVNAEKCTACKRCVKSCPVRAIEIVDKVAVIDYELCYGCGECVAACPEGAIGIQWKTEPDAIQEKIVEHCAGALAEKDGKVVYLSFVTNVSPDCDCWSFSDASVVADIGVLASTDIVAIDQAAYDLVVAARGLPGSRGEGMTQGTDKFREITGIDGTIAMRYAEERGLGTRAYELKTLE